jgi:hypothetical protein
MDAPVRLSDLSAPKQALVRICQTLDFGQIIDLHIRDGEPVYNPAPTLLLDVKLDADCGGRREIELPDFMLRDEILRLFERLEALQAGRIQRIEVRAGIPRRALIEAKLTEKPR